MRSLNASFSGASLVLGPAASAASAALRLAGTFGVNFGCSNTQKTLAGTGMMHQCYAVQHSSLSGLELIESQNDQVQQAQLQLMVSEAHLSAASPT